MLKKKNSRNGLILLTAILLTVLFTGCTGKGSLHINYKQSDAYGTGDYVYSTVTFTGSGLGSTQIYSVEALENLMADENLSYTGEYSAMTRGAIFSKHEMQGLKFYDLLLSLGMSEDLPDDTKIRVISADGYASVMKLGDIKNSTDNTYDSPEASEPSAENVPVILAFASDGSPLTGPVGNKVPGDEITAEEGYVESAENVGGPVRLIAGQQNAGEYNAPDNAKWVTKVIVGDSVEYEKHETGSDTEVLTLTVNDQTGQVAEKTLTWSDIESCSDAVAGYYGDEHYFSGVSLWKCITTQVNFLSREGSVTLTGADGTETTVSIDYLRNLSGDDTGYTTEKNNRIITCLKPGLGTAVDGAAAETGVYALLPAKEGERENSEALLITAVTVNLTGDNTLSENPYGNQTIAITGDGIEDPVTITVNALEQKSDLRIEDENVLGFSLGGLLDEIGMTVDAGDVIVKGNSQTVYTQDDLTAQRDALGIITRQAGTPVAALCCGDVENVTEIEVTAKAGQWNHSASPYDQYLTQTITISGSDAKTTKTYTVEDLENSEYTVRNSYGSSAGINGYEGVLLKDLITENLKAGLEKPSRITVIGQDGYETELDVDDVFNGVDSGYQPGEHRYTILAYSMDGEPLVPDENAEGFNGNNGYGPIRLITENIISKWVKNVSEIRLGD